MKRNYTGAMGVSAGNIVLPPGGYVSPASMHVMLDEALHQLETGHPEAAQAQLQNLIGGEAIVAEHFTILQQIRNAIIGSQDIPSVSQINDAEETTGNASELTLVSSTGAQYTLMVIEA